MQITYDSLKFNCVIIFNNASQINNWSDLHPSKLLKIFLHITTMSVYVSCHFITLQRNKHIIRLAPTSDFYQCPTIHFIKVRSGCVSFQFWCTSSHCHWCFGPAWKWDVETTISGALPHWLSVVACPSSHGTWVPVLLELRGSIPLSSRSWRR